MTVTSTRAGGAPIAVDHGPSTPTEDHEVSSDGAATDAAAPLVAEDMLVEDVSIDGMCGVY
jgi:mycofactocin precursor